MDCLLEQAIAAAQVAYGPEAATDPYRGLHLDLQDVERLLTREPGAPAFQGYGELDDETPSDVVQQDSPLALLQQTFELSAFDKVSEFADLYLEQITDTFNISFTRVEEISQPQFLPYVPLIKLLRKSLERFFLSVIIP